MEHLPTPDPALAHALKLLARRDYSIVGLRRRLESRFGDIPETTIEWLVGKRYLDDRRFTENLVARRPQRSRRLLETELESAGVADEIARMVLDEQVWPSIGDVLEAKMVDLKMDPPLEPRKAARLFRALGRLGYEAEDIRTELERFL